MKRRDRGITMPEALMVVAIIAVLAGIAFVGIIGHLRKMTQLEYDGYAREIYVAAQNHLSRAAYVDYLGRDGDDLGKDLKAETRSNDNTGEYYFIVSNGSVYPVGTTIQNLILPPGSFTVKGGNYLVRYHKDTARVLEVFYWSDTGENGRFIYTPDPQTYAQIKGDYDQYRPSHSLNEPVIGRYPSENVKIDYEDDIILNEPDILHVNGEQLVVYVKNNNRAKDGQTVQLSLYIKEKGSSNTTPLEIPLGSSGRVSTPDQNSVYSSYDYKIILDDITDFNLRFCNIENNNNTITPGKDIEVVLHTSILEGGSVVNQANSSAVFMNSLYADDTEPGSGTAVIRYIRHIENLDSRVSGVGPGTITQAVQKDDLDWQNFLKATKKDESDIPCVSYGSDGSENTNAGTYLPVNLYADFTSYDGGNYSVSNVDINYTGEAGLFGKVNGGTIIRNLELLDFSVAGTTSAGALVGDLGGGTVSNVLAVHSETSNPGNFRISATGGCAGGLVGTMSGGTIEYSAAALLVGDSTTSTAGGLVGTASGGRITGCYAGGHTTNGVYNNQNFNVTGATAGGLVGSSSATITNSYSTCSVSGSGTAGGFVGNMTDGLVENCYCTGFVGGTGTTYAFSGGGTADNCYYYSIVNEYYRDKTGNTNRTPMSTGVGSGTVTAIDGSVQTLNDFVGSTHDAAEPYDDYLETYYDGYFLKSLCQLDDELTGVPSVGNLLATHYGDWPSPEMILVDTRVST